MMAEMEGTRGLDTSAACFQVAVAVFWQRDRSVGVEGQEKKD